MSKSALLSGFTGLVGISVLLAGSIVPATAATTITLPASCTAVKADEPMTDEEIKACFRAMMLLIGQDRNVTIVMGSNNNGHSGGGKPGPAGPRGPKGDPGPQGPQGPIGLIP